MKQYSTAALILAVIAIVFLSNFLFKIAGVRAVESTGAIDSSTKAAVMKKSDYTLAYPGILPDHPLYFLKDVRDKIIELLIVDPERKSEFYLLQSDKLLHAAVRLLDKNEKEKARAAISQSFFRMNMAITRLSTMKANGQQVSAGSVDSIKRAIEKHIEVLTEIASNIDTKEAISSLQKSQEEVMKLQ
jgi:hypothetical protein